VRPRAKNTATQLAPIVPVPIAATRRISVFIIWIPLRRLAASTPRVEFC
jgi:hypothetical protein